MGQIIAFFRAFMTENEENEALALIYWDKVKQEFYWDGKNDVALVFENDAG